MFTELKKEHIDELHKLLNYCQKDKEYFHPHSFDKRYLKRLPKQKMNHYFVLIEADKIIGYSMLRTFGIFPYPTFGGFVHRDYRGKGYGKELLKKTLKKAKELNFEKVLLKVKEENIIAINLYNKVGFKELQKEKDQYWMEIEL